MTRGHLELAAGDVVMVDLEGEGTEQRGRRPVIVVQDPDFGFLSVRYCVPTSRSAGPADFRVDVEVAEEPTRALVEQLRALATRRLLDGDYLGRLPLSDVLDIRRVAATLLGNR